MSKAEAGKPIVWLRGYERLAGAKGAQR